jgi:hypothetical protein
MNAMEYLVLTARVPNGQHLPRFDSRVVPAVALVGSAAKQPVQDHK